MDTVVWWPKICGNSSEYDAFWSPNLTLSTWRPDLPRCLQLTALTWAPAALLGAAAALYGGLLWSRPRANSGGLRGRSALNVSRMALAVLMALSHLLLLAEAATITVPPTSATVPPAFFIAPAVDIVAFLVFALLLQLEWMSGRHTSGLLTVYTLVQLLRGVVTARSDSLQGEQVLGVFTFPVHVIQCILLAILLVLLIPPDLQAAPAYPAYKSELDCSRNAKRNIDDKTPLLQDKAPSEKVLPPSPEQYAPWILYMTYVWMTGLIVRGYRHPLDRWDLYKLMVQDRVGTIYAKFGPLWEQLVTNYLLAVRFIKLSHSSAAPSVSRPSVLATLIRVIYSPWLQAMVYRVIDLGTQFVAPLFLRMLLDFIESNDIYVWKGYVIAAMIFVNACVHSILINRFRYYGLTAGIHLRAAVTAAIYRKSLRLGASAKKQTTAGEIVNFISVDGQKMLEFPIYFNLPIMVPITTVGCVYALWTILGWAAFTGLAVIAVLVPLNGVLVANKIRQLQQAQMVDKDRRNNITGEIFSGIKVLKLYAWEPSFEQKTEAFRRKEMTNMLKINVLSGVSAVIWNCISYIVALVTFATWVLQDESHVLTADVAFVSMAFINILVVPFSLLPDGVTVIGQSFVSMKRVNDFLLLEEVDDSTVERDDDPKYAVKIENASLSWEREGASVLQNVNLRVPPGSLVAVVGQVGAGKSSLMSALLGEMWRRDGHVVLNGSTAYVPQQAWILNDTVKGNILFGKDFNEHKYRKVVKMCALKSDLAILSNGDLTEIGERGINLSGGQKQRVSLARAVYQDESVYLLDDPLSAVDVHVGKQLFDQVIGPRGLLSNKTRILVTHSIRFLPEVDMVVVLKDGQVSETGSYSELIEKGGEFAEFIQTHAVEEQTSDSVKESGHKNSQERRLARRISSDTKDTASSLTSSLNLAEPGKLIQEETAEIGTIKSDVIATYVRAAGAWLAVACVLFHVLSLAAFVVAAVWLSAWTADPVTLVGDGGDGEALRPRDDTVRRLAGYGGLIALQMVLLLCGSLTIAYGCVLASSSLFSRLLARLLRAPMSFFDTTPMGRILNRISRDIDSVDVFIPLSVRTWFFNILPLTSIVVIISYSTPVILAVIIPILIAFYIVQRVFITTARQLRRIDSVVRSPVFAHFDESVVGATSIRAYGAADRFIAKCDRLNDDASMTWYYCKQSERWLGIVLEFLGNLVTVFAAVFAVLQKDTIGAGIAGLSVSYALQVCSFLNFYIRSATLLETYMVSVERIKEYSEIPLEAPTRLPSNAPKSSWPSAGKVQYEQYTTRYRPGLDLVLKGVDCTIKSADKVGIVGRTGAGKSSMALSLFRIIEAAGGRIVVDGVDVSSIGLHDLREKLTIIPQDPVIFSGSLRDNLDPFCQYTDQEVWDAISLAHLKSFVTSTPAGLMYECGENGESLSVGQRQLVCLARALLRNTKILLLDEATAAVDLETDELIQNTIRVAFKNSTVITIAHRINTILDYDKVMVLENGVILEYESPSVLMADAGSVFHSMAKEAGLLQAG